MPLSKTGNGCLILQLTTCGDCGYTHGKYIGCCGIGGAQPAGGVVMVMFATIARVLKN